MKMRINLFKPNTVVCIFTDLKKGIDYTIDITSRKVYSHPQRVKVKANLYAPIGVVFALFYRRFSDRIRTQLYLSEVSQYFIILLVGIGILVGVLAFWLGRKLTNKHILHIDEYLMQYPQSEVINNINEIIEKGSNIAGLNLILIVGGGAGSMEMFNRFLNNYNLGTYFLAVLLFSISCLLLSRIKELVFILGLAPENINK